MRRPELVRGPEVSLGQVLDSRDARAARQREWLKRGGTLVVLTLNMPGPCKRFPLGDWAFRRGEELLENQLLGRGFSLLEREEIDSSGGLEYFLRVTGDPYAVKESTVCLEEQGPLGRLLDIDVLWGEEKKISREAVGRSPRTCLLCQRPGAECARSRAHGLQAVIDKALSLMEEELLKEFSISCGSQGQRALLHEVCCTPKPGLVDGMGQGAHRDMDRFTFLDSAVSLGDYFKKCAWAGAIFEGKSEKLLEGLRPLGLAAEKQMERATKGVNTHKGAIFSLGILCAAAGSLFGKGAPFCRKALLAEAAAIAAPAQGDFEKMASDTAGMRLYQKKKITGVRGQAAAGFPQVVRWGLPALEEGLRRGDSWNGACCRCLCALMAHTEDTNLLHRGGEKGLSLVRQQAAALERAELGEKELLCRMEEMNSLLVARNLSPGGSADLLAVTLLVYFLTKDRDFFDIAQRL